MAIPKYEIDIIIVNWNTGLQLQTALAPLAQLHTEPQLACTAIVVDNGSTDNSLSTIKGYNVKIIENNANLGFGSACNKALPYCKGQFILLLNPDVEWELKTLKELAKVLINKPEVGAIGPRQIDESGKTQTTCGRFPTFSTAVWEVIGLSKVLPSVFTPSPIMFDWPHNESRFVDHVMGSFMLIKREVVQKTGLFDERFFMYYEDLDLSKRIHVEGYKTYFEHSQEIFHEGGGTSKQIKAKRLFYSLRSRLKYYQKHFSPILCVLLTVLTFLIEPFIRTIQAAITMDGKRIVETWKAYGYLLITLFNRIINLS